MLVTFNTHCINTVHKYAPYVIYLAIIFNSYCKGLLFFWTAEVLLHSVISLLRDRMEVKFAQKQSYSVNFTSHFM